MSAILIKADKESSKLLSSIAKKMGGTVMSLTDDQLEDFYLGHLMDHEKTGERVDKVQVIQALSGK